MAKEFYTNGVGSAQTLNPSDESKIKIYDSKADADLDLANIEENEIIATKAGESEGVTFFPVGMITPYGGSSAPSGWLLCDGSAISRTTYAGLFSIIGVSFGQGDGSTTFNLPDLRESVPKGAGLTGNSTNHVDTDGLSVGEFIEDRIKSHNHALETQTSETWRTVNTNTASNTAGAVSTPRLVLGSGTAYEGTRISSAGYTTNEVKSVGVNYIIKY